MDDTFYLDDLSFDKTLINTRSILSENLEKSSEFHSSFCPDISIVTGSNNLDQTFRNELLRIAWKRRQCCRQLLPKKNLAHFLRGKLSDEARKCIFVSTHATIEEFIKKLKRVYAPAKSVYQLQRELGNTFMWERESVLCFAARIKKIADRIEDAHRLDNGGQVQGGPSNIWNLNYRLF